MIPHVLTLTDALATAERERDRLTACLARASATIEETERARYAADDERDAARSALDGLTAAVREVEESEGALETMIDDSEWTLDDERIAEERVAAAHTALDALLSAAPAPTTVPAALVRAYLAAEETMRLVAADDHRRDTYHEWAKRHGAAMDAVDAARAALVAGVARCAP